MPTEGAIYLRAGGAFHFPDGQTCRFLQGTQFGARGPCYEEDTTLPSTTKATMRSNLFNLVPLLAVAACADQSVSPPAEAVTLPAQSIQGGPIVHRVSLGGPDFCEHLGEAPGCDANFSLIAMQFADGTVTGQLTDQYGPADGLHAVVDCLHVQVVPGRTTLEAWVGGVVTRPAHQVGLRIITRVRDNGTYTNDPRPDALRRGIVARDDDG